MLNTIFSLLFSVASIFGGPNYISPEQFGAKGDGKTDDAIALQLWADSLVKTNGNGYLPGKYKTSKPIVFARWSGTDYAFFKVRIIGDATMWDTGDKSKIIATFKDAPILSFHLTKGSIVDGIAVEGLYKPPVMSVAQYFNTPLDKYGDSTCRDSRYSPYAGIAIDPFNGTLPPDSGYPSLRQYYRGSVRRSGSTGMKISETTVGGVTIGIITSPNGYTQNAELLTFERIRIGNCKIGFAGCQAQEKGNKLIGWGAWSTTHTLFVFNKYGAGQPGHYTIDGVNIAGNVRDIINRASAGWGQMTMSNVFAESIRSIGYWYAGSGDVLEKSLINLRYVDQIGYYPDFAVNGSRLNIQNCNIRYYGQSKTPILIPGSYDGGGNSFYLPPITASYGWDSASHKGYEILRIIAPVYTQTPIEGYTAKFRITKLDDTSRVVPGDHVVFMAKGNWAFQGQGTVASRVRDSITVRYITASLKDMSNSLVGIYKKK